ncbi:MAG: shikimate dehydrogenase, partial [Alloalcanivorax venustensis]
MNNDLYAVVGHPISHSKSPRIHSLFALQTGQAVEYTAIQAPLEDFADTVREFFERGGKGLNVTVPFKEQAWQLAEVRTERAEKAGAVNTLYRDDQGRLTADNTDGCGLVRDLTRNHGIRLNGARVLVLGAGGAVRGVLGPILQQQPASVTIANRTVAKAEALAQLFAP